MTPEQIALVQGSFRQVTPMAAEIADLFYGRLFELAPAERPLFPDDLAEQKKKLMQMLGLAVTGLNTPEALLPAVVGLGVRLRHACRCDDWRKFQRSRGIKKPPPRLRRGKFPHGVR